MTKSAPLLGDVIESALSSVGITKERVERFVGGPCGCKERQRKLNAITSWAVRVIAGRRTDAAEHLSMLMGEADDRYA